MMPSRWLLVSILLLAAALRLTHIGVESLWFDEAFAVVAARVDALSILRGEAEPVLPPFYFLALHFWQQAVGESELAVRALSASCSLLAVAAAYRLAARLFGYQAGLWTAGLMAVAPFQVYYAQEARPYALSVLLSVWLLWVFVEATTGSRLIAWAGYVCLATLGLYTHYFFGFVLVALHLWLAIYRRHWTVWRALLVSDAWVVVLFLPIAGMALSRARAVTGGFWIERPSVLATLKTFDFLLFAGTTPRWLVPVALFGTLGLLAVIGLDLARYCQRNRARVSVIVFNLLVVCLPIAAGHAISQLGSSIYLDRSFALITPAYLVLLAIGLTVRPRRSPSLILALLLGFVMVVSLANFYFWPDAAKPGFREAGEFLVGRVEPGDVLLSLHDSTYFSLRYYAPQVESYALETDHPWLLPQAWPRFGVRVAADWPAALPPGARLWVAVEPRLYDGQQRAVWESLDRGWQRLAQFETWGVQLALFQKQR